ncbi:glycogen debranching N-terminal domain-containing protein [Cellulomonas sp.]|uniref:glycogen debranching N-terminal domain-containing protein n=1 Tax=Cellulomonas sp. TaxID=40001 RepID=UPI00344E6689
MTPTLLWSPHDGYARKAEADGCHHADARILSRAMLTADVLEPEPIAAGPAGPGAVEVVSLLRGSTSRAPTRRPSCAALPGSVRTSSPNASS